MFTLILLISLSIYTFFIFYVFEKYNDILLNPKSRKEEYISWFLINGIVCQSPLFFMYIINEEYKFIFAGGLSYIFTLFISSLYMLVTMEDRKNIFKFAREKLNILAIILVILTFGLLSVYPNIKHPFFKEHLVDKPLIFYLIFMIISVITAFQICRPAIDEKYDDQEEKEKSTKPIFESKNIEDELEDFIEKY